MLSEKAPYIVTIVVAGLAWTVTHIVDRILATPLVTYRLVLEENGGAKAAQLTIRNITRDKKFNSVRLILTAAPNDTLTNTYVVPVQPAWEGDQPGKTVGRTFEFTFAEVQPGWEFKVGASYSGPTPPSIRFSTKDTVYFTSPSWSTWLVEHEIGVLIFIFLLGVGALMVALCFARGSSGGQQA